MSSVLMILIVLLISNDPTYLSLVFNVFCVFCACAFRLRNDLYCVEWGVKLYSLTHCACATATFSNPDNLLICDWIVSSFFLSL